MRRVEGAPKAGDKYHLLVPVSFFYAESILSTTAFNNRFTEKRHDLGSCHFPLRCFTMTAQVPPISNPYPRDCAGGRDSGCQRMGLDPRIILPGWDMSFNYRGAVCLGTVP